MSSWLNSLSNLKENTFNKLKSALSKTRQIVQPTISDDSQNKAVELIEITPDYLNDLEDTLISTDIGLEIISDLISKLKEYSKTQNPCNVRQILEDELSQRLKLNYSSINFSEDKLNVFLIVGVNGTGKTTSIGKLANLFKQQGYKTIIAAADTFRAAAESQLNIWADRANVDLVRLNDGANSSTVVYQALDRALKENYQVLLIDTAGRLHNKVNLMDELKKIKSVIDKHGKQCNLNTFLTLDASCGQNGLQQASVFSQACNINGIILSKLDGTSKGGVVFNIANNLRIPVRFIGLGEDMNDLKEFEPEFYVRALLDK